ncbi:MAG: porin family protein [Prolixibacteraceae bacterium]
MNIKNSFLIVALILIGFCAQSQSNGISFGLRGGFDMQTFNGQDINGDKLELSQVPRFNVGAIVDIPVAPEFYFQTGLLYTTKGAKSDDQFLGLDMSAEYNIAYVELPLNFVYKSTLGNGKIVLGFGPYLAYGIGGNAKFTMGSTSSEEKIVFTNEFQSLNPLTWNNFKAFDYGGNLFFGYQLSNGILVQLNTQLGMAQINAENTTIASKASFKNTGYGISIGYMF